MTTDSKAFLLATYITLEVFSTIQILQKDIFLFLFKFKIDYSSHINSESF